MTRPTRRARVPSRPTRTPSNPCGPVGATLAHAMFTTMGWSSWLVPPALLVVNLLLVRRRALPDRTSPSIGFAMVLVVAAATIHKLSPTLRPSPPVGSGGYVGALVAVFLELHFGNAGLILILAADRAVRPGCSATRS